MDEVPSQTVEKPLEIIGEGRGDGEPFMTSGMAEYYAVGMEEEPTGLGMPCLTPV